MAISRWNSASYVGSIVGFSCYIYVLRATTPARSSTYAYVNPLVALFLGWWLAHETITTSVGLAAALILSGVACILVPRGRVG